MNKLLDFINNLNDFQHFKLMSLLEGNLKEPAKTQALTKEFSLTLGEALLVIRLNTNELLLPRRSAIHAAPRNSENEEQAIERIVQGLDQWLRDTGETILGVNKLNNSEDLG